MPIRRLTLPRWRALRDEILHHRRSPDRALPLPIATDDVVSAFCHPIFIPYSCYVAFFIGSKFERYKNKFTRLLSSRGSKGWTRAKKQHNGYYDFFFVLQKAHVSSSPTQSASLRLGLSLGVSPNPNRSASLLPRSVHAGLGRQRGARGARWAAAAATTDSSALGNLGAATYQYHTKFIGFIVETSWLQFTFLKKNLLLFMCVEQLSKAEGMTCVVCADS